MAAIDDKVVSMSFESSRFETGVNSVIRALEKLKSALKFPDAGKGLEDINSAAKRLDLSHIGRTVDDIKGRLSALRIVAIAVFADIARRALAAGTRFLKAFTLDPIKAGFSEYTTNLNAVQTILANTRAAGVKLEDVNKALKVLNDYSDKTIYNFSQMAKNIGTFTAAGVELNVATNAIKGIANLAALSGSNAEQASTAMYQLSQAIAAGRVTLQDWNSVVNAGMGGTVFQRALAQTAVAMGTLEEKSLKLVGPMKNVSIAGESFRNSIAARPGEKSWLTSKVLTNTLQQFTGDLSAAELKAQGFNDAQIKAIQATGTAAMKAATEVKTLGGVIDTAKETAISGWAETWQIIFGDFGEAKTLFTAVSNAINGFIKTSADARNNVLSDWKALGGRTLLIKSIKTAFEALKDVIAPIKEAFRDIFPAATGKSLFELTKRFSEFAKALKPSEETVENLKRTFRGLFALLDIGKQIISGIFTVFGRLFQAAGVGSGGFLSITASIGDFLVSIDKALKEGGRLQNFFEGLGDALSAPLKVLGKIKDALADLFGGFSSGGFSGQIDSMTGALTPFQRILEAVGDAWTRFVDGLSSVNLQPAVDAIIQLIEGLGTAIGNAVSNMNFEAILQVIRTGLFAGIFLIFKRFLGKGTFAEQLAGAGGGILKNIAGSFDALRGSMVAMQQNIKAKTLKEIAIAIALLTASVVALSFVDPEKLKSALTAMAFAFGELLGAMALLDKVGSSAGFIKLPFIAAGLIVLAGAIDVLTIAVLALSRLSWEELAKGLGGVGFLLAAISVAAIPLSANSAGLIRAGIGITAIAIALRILASAVAAFGSMSWTELGKGLGAVGVGLAILAGATRAIPPGIVIIGAGLIAVAFGLKLLASAVSKFGELDWKVMGKGMLGIAGSLVIIAGAMRLMPGNMILTAAGLLIVSVALGKIANAVEDMGGMSVKEIAKGLITLGGSLLILAAALYAMSGTLAGAAALTIAAAGIALLAPALERMGGMSWGEIIKGLVLLGAALAVVGIAGALISPVIPALLGLGAALLLIGGGLALAGAGIFLISAGLSALAVAAPTGVGVLIAALNELLEAIPEMSKNLILGFLEIVRALAATAPQFVDAMIKIIESILDAIIRSTPKMVEAFTVLLNAFLGIIRDNRAKVIQAGFDLILALLEGIKNNIGEIVNVVVDIVGKFLGALASNLGRIISAGVKLLTSFLSGIAQGFSKVVASAISIVTKFLGAIISYFPKIVTAGVSIIGKFISGIISSVGRVITAGINVVTRFIQGVGSAGTKIVTAAVEAITKFIRAIAHGAVRLADEGAKAIVFFLNGVANAINAHAGEMRAAGLSVALAIIDGMTFGLASRAASVAQKAFDLGKGAISALGKAVGKGSPSKEAIIIGEAITEGLSVGMADSRSVVNSASDLGYGLINTFKKVFQITSPSKVMQEIGSLVRLGFLQGLMPPTDSDPFGIQSAFSNLNSKLTESMRSTRELVAEEQAKLKELQKASKPDLEAIKEAQRTIEKNQAVLVRLAAAHKTLTSTLKDEKKELLDIARDYQNVSDKLDAANDALADAIKTRDDAITSFTDQYATLPEVVKEGAEGKAADQVAEYIKALQYQADAVAAYQSTLDQLRKLGLDDATYQKLLREGTADQQFAEALLKGGKTAVDSINKLDEELLKNAKKLAKSAGDGLYQSGVDAAQGLVDGLKSKKNALRKAMEELADEMIDALKKSLKIKSPSQVFAEIGKFAMEGMALGFTNSAKVVTDAVDDAAKDALSTMRRSMQNITDVVSAELNPNPVITPILDLTQIRSQTSELAALTRTVPLATTTSLGQASLISSDQRTSQGEETTVAPGGTSVKFEQNNYSPEALSEVEIYRQTKNQLSQLKTALALT